MKRILLAGSLCMLLFSCNTVKLASSKRNISELGLDWELAEKVNPVYVPVIDSVLNSVINRFNEETHSFKVHKKLPAEDNYLTLKFNKGKFVSKGGVTAGYVVSGLGLIATPLIMNAASNGEFFLAFCYWPVDKLALTATLSPALSEGNRNTQFNGVETSALFSSKTNRIFRVSKRLNQTVYKLLNNIDKQVKK